MFAIIIGGSIPTLRPLWKAIRGLQYTGYIDTSSSDYRNNSEQAKQSKRSKTGDNSSANPGIYTVALQELDKEYCDVDTNGPSSSRERIL